MSSADKESLEEYEKNYLTRLEEEKNPTDLQNLIFKMSKKTKVLARYDYVGLCAACTKGVDRKEMVYKNSHLFHPDCFAQHGNEYQATTNLMNEERRTKVDLVYLKNLQIRSGNSVEESTSTEKIKRRIKEKSQRRRPSRKKTTKTKRRVKTRSRRKISRKRFIRKGRSKRRR